MVYVKSKKHDGLAENEHAENPHETRFLRAAHTSHLRVWGGSLHAHTCAWGLVLVGYKFLSDRNHDEMDVESDVIHFFDLVSASVVHAIDRHVFGEFCGKGLHQFLERVFDHEMDRGIGRV